MNCCNCCCLDPVASYCPVKRIFTLYFYISGYMVYAELEGQFIKLEPFKWVGRLSISSHAPSSKESSLSGNLE